MTGLDFQPVFVPFAAGLNTKAHPFALDAPGLTICQNAEFDEVGALRLRHPYTSIGVNIYGGGTLASVRKLAVVGDELLAFTPDALYSWSEALTAWIRKDTHLAVTVTEATRFGNPSDQVFADRAELGGVAVMVWTEALASAVTAHLGAYDTTTGATLIARTSFGAGNTRPRVVALATKIVVTWTDAGAGLVAKVIDPAAPAFAATGATLLDTEEGAYDIVKDPTADRAVWVVRFVGGGSYAVGAVTSALAVTDVTKARNADGVIAVSVAPSGVVQVLRTYGTTVLGDLLTSAFVDVFTGTVVGSAAGTINQLTGAHRSVTNGGYYRCYAFWSSQQSAATGSNFQTQSQWIDTNNSVSGGASSFLLGLAVASRAFGYNGEVYLWAVFAGEASTAAYAGGGGAAPVTFLGIRAQFQNTYFLYRDDGHLATKATWSRAGGFGYYDGHLPGVALVAGTTGYAWAGVERQIIVTGGTSRTDYSARAPRDIAFTFDSDAARRVVHFGRTAYVSGGLVLQYDGEALTDVGFCQYPWYLALATNPGGAAAAGVYSYKASYRWDNARGETERSTTAVGAQLTIAANDQVDILTSTCRASRKQSAVRLPALELWRSQVNAPVDAPFYLITSRDPSATGDNGYLSSDPTTDSVVLQGDILHDDSLAVREQHPENGSVLARLAPPGASILVASDARLFLAGIPGEPSRIYYSLQRGEGEIAAFHGALSFALPTEAGAITALALLNEALVAFTASSIYVIPGDGFDNAGGGSNYGAPLLVSSDVGALSHDTVALTPTGLVFFSRKGWYRLTGGRDIEYIGAPVEGFNADTWVAAQVVESQHQVRFLSSARMLVWDYLVGQWSEWTETGGRDIASWRGMPMLLDTAPKVEAATFAAATYDLDVETAWIKIGGPQGFARIRKLMLLGEYKAAHTVRVRVGFDYAATYTDDKSRSFTGLTAGDPAQFKHGPSRQRVESMRVRVTVTPTVEDDAFTLTGFALDAAPRRGLYPRLAATRKQ